MTSNEKRETSNGAVLVTGANGFVGRAVCDALAGACRRVRRAVRVAPAGAADTVAIGDIGGGTDWRAALDGMQSSWSCINQIG